MNHITLNTGNSELFLEPPLLELDVLKKGKLPEPYDRFRINTLFSDDGWFYFDLALDDEHITANMVCHNKRNESDCWQQMVSLYLQIYDSAPPVPANAPVKPWLATVALPCPTIFTSQIIASIEQAIAISGINKSLLDK